MVDNQGRVQIVVDGVTGVGKSSLVQILAEHLKLKAYNEVFEDKNQLLHKFFYDRARWAFPMQINFLTNRYKQYREASCLYQAIMDRSIYSDAIFARMYLEDGYLTKEEFAVYHNLLQSMLADLMPPRLMVRLKVDANEAICRIHKRGRADELEVERAYWERLNRCYDATYENYSGGHLLTVDVTCLDFVNNQQDRNRLLDQIITAYYETKA
ncbi:deoxynucleoside kinase [Heliorestis convoluta]|uniref:Deoxynucleoside kinase family protein n=1 Tax=Heliorestis convoluta TaxID=356322 RepID=A0A5Q2N8J3_9FIRM|nr:deoxynucleoside kinase [Heliorestis convoluta]QGG48815.1 deoxynucleoside kinase family protein [Heliorestis convoluta]